MVHAAREVHEVHEVDAAPPGGTAPERQPGKAHLGFPLAIFIGSQLTPALAFLTAMSMLYGGPGTGAMWLVVGGLLPVAAAAFGFALYVAEGEPG